MVSVSAYERVTRNMVENLVKGFDNLKRDMKSDFADLKTGQTELFNHQSSRLPMWATILFTVMGSTLTGLAVWIITH